MSNALGPIDLFAKLRWLDGRPLLSTIEPYRRRLFEQFFETGPDGAPRYNVCLAGRAKKNWKSTDAMLAAFQAVMQDSPQGSQVYVLANDEQQAGDDLSLSKKLVKVNPLLDAWLVVRKNRIERKDEGGFIEVLPANDALGAHGKTYRLLVIDEIHGYRTHDVLEALAMDPTRPDAQQWITSYATIHHRPGVPLFDLFKMAREGSDPRLLLSWYAADYCSDPEFAERTPEERANPSMASWGNPGYLDQQRRRLPSHKYRRLHLNLPGSPEGSAYAAEVVMDAIDRGVKVRPPVAGVTYYGGVDMCGGSADDAALGIAHREGDRVILDRVVNQGQKPPFDPRQAIARFVSVLREYGCRRVAGDRYAGLTFRLDFERAGIGYDVSRRDTSDAYEDFEPLVNGARVRLVDEPSLEQQLLALVWKGGHVTHPAGEHDDWATAAVLACLRAADAGRGSAAVVALTVAEVEAMRQPPISNTLAAIRQAKHERRLAELAQSRAGHS